MSLSFIPRNLSKSGKARKPESSSSKAGPPQNLTGLPVSSSPLVATQASVVTQKTTKYDDTDYANLIALSLSNYALWLDSDLRQKLRVGVHETSHEDSGCKFFSVPYSALIDEAIQMYRSIICLSIPSFLIASLMICPGKNLIVQREVRFSPWSSKLYERTQVTGSMFGYFCIPIKPCRVLGSRRK